MLFAYGERKTLPPPLYISSGRLISSTPAIFARDQEIRSDEQKKAGGRIDLVVFPFPIPKIELVPYLRKPQALLRPWEEETMAQLLLSFGAYMVRQHSKRFREKISLEDRGDSSLKSR